jgi:hypothetical protein
LPHNIRSSQRRVVSDNEARQSAFPISDKQALQPFNDFIQSFPGQGVRFVSAGAQAMSFLRGVTEFAGETVVLRLQPFFWPHLFLIMMPL